MIRISTRITHTLVNVSTVLADPFSFPIVVCFGFLGSGRGRFLVAKHIETSAAAALDAASHSKRRRCRRHGSRTKGIGLKGAKEAEEGNKKGLHHHGVLCCFLRFLQKYSE